MEARKIRRKKAKISWRKPKGRHSKMRKRRVSYQNVVTIGHKKQKSLSGKIQGLTPVLVHNLEELKKAGKESILILAKVGAKKKLELIKEAEAKKLKILNVAGGKK